MPTPTEAAPADGAVTGSTLLNKNPTVYSPYSPSSVPYKYPDGTDMTHFSLAYLAGKWDKVQYNPDTREIKYMPEMPPADENRSVTKQFGEFRIADFKTRVDLCERFFRTKNLFCEPALLDITAFFVKWMPLFEHVMDVYDLDVSDKKQIVDNVYLIMDDAFRLVIKEKRKFSHDEYAGDAALFGWAAQLVAMIKNRKSLTAVFPAVAMKENDLKAIVHTAVREALRTATATDLPRVAPPLQ